MLLYEKEDSSQAIMPVHNGTTSVNSLDACYDYRQDHQRQEATAGSLLNAAAAPSPSKTGRNTATVALVLRAGGSGSTTPSTAGESTPPSSYCDHAGAPSAAGWAAGDDETAAEAVRRVTELEAELREANNRAKEAEDLSTERGEAIERLLSRLEAQGSGTFVEPPPATSPSMPSFVAMLPRSSDGSARGRFSAPAPAKSSAPRATQELGYNNRYPHEEGVECVEVAVGREDEGLLLGGGRVLHRLKEELGGTLEYRRSQGVVCVYGQRGAINPLKAAAYVRTALLLRDGRGAAMAEEYSLARICMEDLLAECTLKTFQETNRAPRKSAATTSTTSGRSGNSATTAVPTPPSDAGSGQEPGAAATPSSPPSSSSSSSSSASSSSGPPSCGLTASAEALSPSSSSTPPLLPNVGGNIISPSTAPPSTASLRIIAETYGCVIDVLGEAGAANAEAALHASAAAFGAGRVPASRLLRPVGSASPIGHRDVLVWGPACAVGGAVGAVCSLVSGRAVAQVAVGARRIGKRDRGFWVNCEALVSGDLSLEVNHKNGVATLTGRPEAVEEGRRQFQDKLASLFPGDFLAVPMPRAALKDLANARGLARASAEAGRCDDEQLLVPDSTQQFGRDGSHDGSCDEDGGVEMWADWPCSCVRLRGDPATVRRAAKALYAALAQWNTLEVSVRVDRGIVTRLLSRSGRILSGISSNMGITLLVERESGVVRGRASSEEKAKEANRVLRLKVAALSQRRSEQGKAAGFTAPYPRAAAAACSGLLPSTHSEHTGGSAESSCNGFELTDAFEELQAFFKGSSLSDGSSPTSLTKRSCVFVGVGDSPGGTDSAASSASRAGTRAGFGPQPSVAPPSRCFAEATAGGSSSGGDVSARALAAAAAGLAAKPFDDRLGHDRQPHYHLRHRQHQLFLQQVVHTSRQGVVVPHPALPPSSGADSPRFSPSVSTTDDAELYSRSRRHRDPHQSRHGGASLSASPSPTRFPLPLTAPDHYQRYVQLHQEQQRRGQQQQRQQHFRVSDGRSTWSLPPEEAQLRYHRSGFDSYRQQQQRLPTTMLQGGEKSHTTTRAAVTWVSAEELGQHAAAASTAADFYSYRQSRAPPPPTPPLLSSSHTAVNMPGASEICNSSSSSSVGGVRYFSAAYGGGGRERGRGGGQGIAFDGYERAAPSVQHQLNRLAWWESGEPSIDGGGGGETAARAPAW